MHIDWQSAIGLLTHFVATLGAIFYVVRKNMRHVEQLDSDVKNLSVDVAVIKTQILAALNVSMDQKADHDQLIKAQKDIDKNAKDINSQHDKIRHLQRLYKDHNEQLHDMDKRIEFLNVSNH